MVPTFHARRHPHAETPHQDPAFAEYREAVGAAVEAARALSHAPPGGRTDAHRALVEALARRDAAERAFERSRQAANGERYTGRPRHARF